MDQYCNTGPVFWNPSNPNHQTVRPGSLGLREARHINEAYSPPAQHLVEIRDAGHMGLGLFAKADIPRGARILAEDPIFAMPAITPLPNLQLRRNDKDIQDFVDHIALRGLDDERIRAMETLYCDEKEGRDEDTKNAIMKYLCEHLAPSQRRTYTEILRYLGSRVASRAPGDFAARVYASYTRLYAIWRNNRIKFGEGATMDSGVFLIASRINHSCCPNAWYNFNPNTGYVLVTPVAKLTTHAIRDIAAGEQIFVGYDALSLKLREERVVRLAEWGIPYCVCALCTDPLVEALQQRAYRLWQAADCWVRPWPLAEQRLAKKGIAPCKDAFEALKMGEEVIALLTHPMWNVREMALAEAYKLCSIICERLATAPEMGLSYDEVVQYWQRAMRFSGQKCQVYMFLEGTDGREMKKADMRLKELGTRRDRWTALQNGWQWPPRP